MKIPARFLLSLGFIVLASFLFSGKILASDNSFASQTSSSTYSPYSASNPLNTESNVPQNLHSTMQVLTLETLSAVVCQLAGYDPMTVNHKCLGVNPKTGQIGFVANGGGTIAVVGKLIDYTFVPPASTSQYISYLKSNFGPIKGAYAQDANTPNPCASGSSARGVGFCSLQPILGLWITMRNIVYLILILVFVVIGLGIMLRVHIDPRTVMTVQNQIPKIIMGIVVITFSFAIAGLMIDFMWVATYLFATVLSSATGTTDATMLGIVQAGNPLDAANHLPGGIINIASQTAKAFSDLITSVIDPNNSNIILQALGGIINILAILVLIIAIIVALLRLWLSLVLSYINVLLDVIFAPFWIIAGLVPGSPMGMGAWFRDLIANLSVFPVAIGFFILANYFIGAFANNTNNVADVLTPPLLGGTNNAAVSAIIGLGFILMLPNLLTTMKAALKAPKINLSGLMGPVSAGTGVILGGPKRFAGGVVSEATRRRLPGELPDAPWKKVIRGFSSRG